MEKEALIDVTLSNILDEQKEISLEDFTEIIKKDWSNVGEWNIGIIKNFIRKINRPLDAQMFGEKLPIKYFIKKGIITKNPNHE